MKRQFVEDMEKSGKKLAPPKLAYNLKKMEQALRGCRRIAVVFNKVMAREGRNLHVGKSTTYRVMREMGLYHKDSPQAHIPMERPKEPFTSFAMDFKNKIVAGGEHIHILDIIDEFDNAIGVLNAYHSANAENVIASLVPFVRTFSHNKIVKIRCDNGKEFQNNDVTELCSKSGIVLNFTEKGCPWMNAFVERNIRTVTEECLNLNWLNDISQTQNVLDQYKHKFNRRENMGLEFKTPLERLAEFYASNKVKCAV